MNYYEDWTSEEMRAVVPMQSFRRPGRRPGQKVLYWAWNAIAGGAILMVLTAITLH